MLDRIKRFSPLGRGGRAVIAAGSGHLAWSTVGPLGLVGSPKDASGRYTATTATTVPALIWIVVAALVLGLPWS